MKGSRYMEFPSGTSTIFGDWARWGFFGRTDPITVVRELAEWGERVSRDPVPSAERLVGGHVRVLPADHGKSGAAAAKRGKGRRQ